MPFPYDDLTSQRHQSVRVTDFDDVANVQGSGLLLKPENKSPTPQTFELVKISWPESATYKRSEML